jgi:DNA-binding response OmpR family regulator
MKARHTIWILEDDPGAQFIYSETLEIRFNLKFFGNLADFREAAFGPGPYPSLAITDLRLPDGTLLELMPKDKLSNKFNFPYMVVSSVDDLDVLRACFNEGALDYLTKPFNKSELITKIDRLIDQQSFLNVQVDPTTLAVKTSKGEEITLTTKEFQLLSLLKRDPKLPKCRNEIIAAVWKDVNVTKKNLDVHIFNLRKKLEELNLDIEFIPPESFRLQQKG